jgi:hypothetical protein
MAGEGLSLQLTEEHEMIRMAARDFAQKEIAPIAAEFDESGDFPRETIRKMGEMGFMGIEVPEEYGGAGMDTLAYVLAVEEVAKVDAAHAVIMSVNNSLFSHGIQHFECSHHANRPHMIGKSQLPCQFSALGRSGVNRDMESMTCQDDGDAPLPGCFDQSLKIPSDRIQIFHGQQALFPRTRKRGRRKYIFHNPQESQIRELCIVLGWKPGVCHFHQIIGTMIDNKDIRFYRGRKALEILATSRQDLSRKTGVDNLNTFTC